jgi:2-polyprenyl-6-methoxyphenol hydroxylase-like FAD-dependent oxidoreductase
MAKIRLQGANHAFEDGLTLAMLLSRFSENPPFSRALQYWQSMRQRRVEQVRKLTTQLSNRRLSPAEKEKIAAREV